MNYFSLEDCPICGSKMNCYEDLDYIEYKCKNSCFSISNLYENCDTITIFNDREDYWHIDKNYSFKIKELMYKHIEKKIEYWKENNRYLLKILEV